MITEFEIIALLSKWGIYLSVAAVIGGAFMLNLIRSSQTEVVTIARYIGLGAIAGLVAVSVNYLAQVGSFAESGFAGMFNRDMNGFLWSSSIGDSVCWRLTGFIFALSASGLLLKVRQSITWFAIGLLGISSLMLAISFSFIGHSTELNTLAQGLIVLHILAIGSWLGSFYPLWHMCSNIDAVLVRQVMEKFGQLGMAIVSLVAISGAGLLWMLFDKPNEFVTSDYGLAVIIKLSFVFTVLLFAATHKFLLVPNLASDSTQSHHNKARAKLKKSIGLEALIGFIILAVTALLSSVLAPVSLS